MEKNFVPEQYTVKEQKSEKQELKTLYKGIWADHLENGQLLSVGGSIFRPDLNLKLELDFESFSDQLMSAVPERLEEVFQETGEGAIVEYLEKLKSDIDPRLFYACLQVQRKVNDLLEIESQQPQSGRERSNLYDEENPPKLSQLVGKTQCAERAALGQFILQKLNVDSSYMSGIVMDDPDDNEEYPENHSFLAVRKNGKCYVFDIARSHKGEIPRMFEMQSEFQCELFENTKDILACGEDIFSHHKSWFGVGDATAGKHQKVPVVAA